MIPEIYVIKLFSADGLLLGFDDLYAKSFFVFDKSSQTAGLLK